METEREFVEWLCSVIEQGAESDGFSVSVRSYVEAGLLTTNEGATVRIGDAQFQITVVRSK